MYIDKKFGIMSIRRPCQKSHRNIIVIHPKQRVMIIMKILLVIIFTLTSFSVYAKDKYCSNKGINPSVQLQDNGWLKIIDQYVAEYTPEEFYNGDKPSIEMHKDGVRMGLSREKITELNVKIQFLKPCIATSEMDEWFEKQNPSGGPDALIPLVGEKGECFKLLVETEGAHGQSTEEMRHKLIEKCPHIMEYLKLRFRCDYRLKVFLTQFSPSKFKKYESSTDGFFPEAPITDIRNNRINRKSEMLPGETMWIKFYISSPATSATWCVWVPK